MTDEDVTLNGKYTNYYFLIEVVAQRFLPWLSFCPHFFLERHISGNTAQGLKCS